jgi:Cyclin, N-terminal domain
MTPSTPVTGFTHINLQTYQFTGLVDIWLDDPDRDDPIRVSDYAQDMYAFFREKEVEFLVNEHYVYEHKYFGLEVRHELVDWLISVHWKFQLVPEVLYLATNILDRYMEMNINGKETKTDLVALACLRIAAKQEDFVPSLQSFEDVCDKEFEGTDVSQSQAGIAVFKVRN